MSQIAIYKTSPVSLCPLPGVGHVISTVELAKVLYERDHHFSITILLMHLQIPSVESKITSYVQSIGSSYNDIHFVDLPLIDLPSKNDQGPVPLLSLFIEKHKSHVKEAINKTSLSSSSIHVTALILDLFATTMIDVGVELGIPTYIYFTSGVASLGFMLHLPVLHVRIPCEYKDYQGEVEVPGMPPLPPVVMPELMMNKKDDEYTWYVYHGRRFREANGLNIVYTFAELEQRALKALIYLPHP